MSILSLGLSAQVVYVDADATGSGDGSSWANAFTDLAAALDAAEAGNSVWVADGRYVTPADTSFVINKELTLLGGFNGTETDAGDADASANLTILSGDVAGDDVEGVYDSITRMDNQRVLFVADTVTTGASSFTATVSGFTIRDGNRNGFVEGFLGPFAGGGLFATGQVIASNLIFEYNYSDFGSAIAVLNLNADGSTFSDITATNNFSGDRWIFYNRNTDDVVIRKSAFGGANEGTTPNGMVFSLDVIDFTVEDCTFDDIQTTGRGGAVHVEGVAGTATVSNVTVTNSSADLGGAIYLRNFDIYLDADGNNFTGNTVVENVTMTDIASSRWGGALLVSQVNSVVRNVTVSDVESLTGGGLGGALYLQSNADPGEVPLTIDWSDIDLSDVEASGTGGGIFIFNDADYVSSLRNVTMNNVTCIGSGGGLYVSGAGPAPAEMNVMQLDSISINASVANATPTNTGGFGGGSIFFGQDINVTNSTFTNNESALSRGNGAGIYAQGDNISVTVDNSVFTGNRALSGSGLAVFGEGQQTSVSNSEFRTNGTARAGGEAARGAAMAFFQGNGSNVTVDNCQISENSVSPDGFLSGGGAFYISDVTARGDNTGNVTITNSRMELNSVAETSNGGAILFVDATNTVIENTDFFFNSANDGGAISNAVFVIRDTIDNIPSVSLPPFNVSVKDALIVNNSAGNQGGAISTSNYGMDFTNVVFANNTVSDGGGGGGAIIFNGSGPIVNQNAEFEGAAPSAITSTIVNCTFFGNRNGQADASVGNAIAIFQPQNNFDDVAQSTSLTLQNNAFVADQDGLLSIELEPATEEPATAFGTVTVTSLGGNFFNDENGVDAAGMAFDFTLAGDMVNAGADVDDLFEDAFEDPEDEPNFLRPFLSDDNPLIDNGTTGALVPDAGVNGNPRGETPDIGAYELEWSATGVQTIADSGLDMDFFPNPTVDVVNIRSNDASITEYTVVLSDNTGRVLRTNRYNGTVNRVDLTNVPTGVYNLQLMINGNVYSQQIVKQ